MCGENIDDAIMLLSLFILTINHINILRIFTVNTRGAAFWNVMISPQWKVLRCCIVAPICGVPDNIKQVSFASRACWGNVIPGAINIKPRWTLFDLMLAFDPLFPTMNAHLNCFSSPTWPSNL